MMPSSSHINMCAMVRGKIIVKIVCCLIMIFVLIYNIIYTHRVKFIYTTVYFGEKIEIEIDFEGESSLFFFHLLSFLHLIRIILKLLKLQCECVYKFSSAHKMQRIYGIFWCRDPSENFFFVSSIICGTRVFYFLCCVSVCVRERIQGMIWCTR